MEKERYVGKEHLNESDTTGHEQQESKNPEILDKLNFLKAEIVWDEHVATYSGLESITPQLARSISAIENGSLNI